MGVTIQKTINQHNVIVSKKRLTHSLTRFGWAHLRIVYLVVSLCLSTEPNDPDLHKKVDWSKA
jgi:hypothetical protein